MEKNLNQTGGNIHRVAVIGPESTGKTTLSKALAEHFQTHWVPEYMRGYCQILWDEWQQTCRWEDLLPIAMGQMQSENRLAQTAHDVLICDTCLWELMVYACLYFDKCPPQLEAAAIASHYDTVFLTDIDVPWVADDLRDKPQEREKVLALFKDFLNRNHIAFTVLSGPHEQRLQQAVNMIEKALIK
ncbi:AAA family ATPase [Neisseria iguanae]|uniref:Nicotinate-nucleotide adenylyltransferase n=1 Tax=Neisseria iguanae TaxID=90242 RepID=A0A2P7TX75_9NEIS|nr:ATP-binding protein [Neisseria iguanae]PSJ79317.1 nicotinate-nucleotide adenylyltransferase [Neisseria iguanae]